MREYLDAGNQDRIYNEQGDCVDLVNEEFDYDKASARILGRDVARLLSDDSRSIVAKVLSDQADQHSADALALAMVRNNLNYYGDYDTARLMLEELRIGVSE